MSATSTNTWSLACAVCGKPDITRVSTDDPDFMALVHGHLQGCCDECAEALFAVPRTPAELIARVEQALAAKWN
jgi:hypothetical protein